MRDIALHLGLLGVSGVLAFAIWTRDEPTDLPKAAQVEVWSGKPEAVDGIAYESSSRKLRLEPRKDALGRWYVAHVEKTEEAAFAHPPMDGGAPPALEPPKRTTQTFVGVKEADEFVQKLAPLMALRAVGKVEPAKASDFGLDTPDGTLKVKIAGKEHVLTIGGQTPGGGERYAKYGASGDVFAISNELSQSLNYADTRLIERDFNGFSLEDVQKIKISRSGKAREVVRVTGKRDAWADVTTPDKADETVVNWLSKLEKVRIVEYVEKPTPPRPEQLVVRVEYLSGSKTLGTLELYKVADQPSAEYLARSEHSRWYTKVINSAAEQVDQDINALLK